MFVTGNDRNNNLLIEIEKVVTDADKHPKLVGKIVSGALNDKTLVLPLPIHGEKLGWILAKVTRSELFEANAEGAVSGSAIAFTLLGDPIKEIPPLDRLQVGNAIPSLLANRIVEERQTVRFQSTPVVVSGCLIGAALFLLPPLIFGWRAIGFEGAFILILILLGFLIYGLIVLSTPVRNWIKLKRNHADTTAQVVDRQLAIWQNSEGTKNVRVLTVIEFMTPQADGSTKRYLLKFDGQELYERFPLGSSINVRYAVDDPRVAQVEGEYRD